jgi:hypothetical protein
MRQKHFLLSIANRVFVVMLLASACASADATEFTGRGVFNFKSGSGCPIGGLTNEATECDRVALDDTETRATVDGVAHTIQISNNHSYPSKTIVGDVLLQGSGQASDGKRVPLSFHLVLSKSGENWSVSSHVHAPVKGNFTRVEIDPYLVKVAGPDAESVVLAPTQIAAEMTHPPVITRVASDFVQVRDNRTKDAKDADITIALGVGKASKPVMRARLHTDVLTTGNVDSVLKQGTWALELEALTGQIPEHVAQRELFLFGFDGQVLLKPLLDRGFKKHEKLTVGALNGKGYLRYGDQQQPFSGAEASARAFLQQSFIGLVLGWHQLEASASAP